MSDGRRTPAVAGALPIELVLVDFDDTLVDTAPRFAQARRDLLLLLQECGFDEAAAWHAHHELVDPPMRARFGFGPQRMGPAFRQTYEVLCAQAEQRPDARIAARCEVLGQAVLGPPPPVAGALNALSRLADRLPTVLYTQSGDADYQRECVRTTGVLDVLGEERIHICAHKTSEAFARVLATLGVQDPRHAWMIGNSIRSDINPALVIGANAILVEIAEPWSYDVVEPLDNGFARVPSFAAAVDLLLGDDGA